MGHIMKSSLKSYRNWNYYDFTMCAFIYIRYISTAVATSKRSFFYQLHIYYEIRPFFYSFFQFWTKSIGFTENSITVIGEKVGLEKERFLFRSNSFLSRLYLYETCSIALSLFCSILVLVDPLLNWFEIVCNSTIRMFNI